MFCSLQVRIEPINASLLSPLLSRVRGQIDLLIFNPPYVPTEAEEEAQAQLEARIQKLKDQARKEGREEKANQDIDVGGLDAAAAWAGGETGTRLLKELIEFGGEKKDQLEGEEASQEGIEVSNCFCSSLYLSAAADFYHLSHARQYNQSFLSPGGSFFLVAIKENDPPAIVKELLSRGLKAEVS